MSNEREWNWLDGTPPPAETAETILARVTVKHHTGPTWGDGAWGVALGDNDNGWAFDGPEGHGEAIHFETVYRAVLADLLDRVVRAEREACAAIAEASRAKFAAMAHAQYAYDTALYGRAETASEIVEGIRARSKP